MSGSGPHDLPKRVEISSIPEGAELRSDVCKISNWALTPGENILLGTEADTLRAATFDFPLSTA
jgi:hypothetical protein